jgi:hypothetical protein
LMDVVKSQVVRPHIGIRQLVRVSLLRQCRDNIYKQNDCKQPQEFPWGCLILDPLRYVEIPVFNYSIVKNQLKCFHITLM